MKIVSSRRLRNFVEEKLYDDQSPKAIAGRLKHENKRIKYVSKNGIYSFIHSVHGRRIEWHRKKQKQRQKRLARHTKLSGRTFIDKRPKYIDKRQRLGNVESDFIVSGKSGKGVLLVVVDRKTRASFLEKISAVTIANVHEAFLKIKQRFPELKTITTDNDLLLQKHEELGALLKVKIYFCHPYHSWEKGTVENTNKCIRKYLPKSSNISSYSRSFFYNLAKRLNRRIMECLKYLTPA